MTSEAEQRACAATHAADLEKQIMDPFIPKNEREHWAADEIERLRAAAEFAMSQPWLGNATNRQLIDEIRARFETEGLLDYSTVGGNAPAQEGQVTRVAHVTKGVDHA